MIDRIGSGGSQPFAISQVGDLSRLRVRRLSRDDSGEDRLLQLGLERFAEKLRGARLSLERLEQYDRASRLQRLGSRAATASFPAVAISSSDLGLDPIETAATLRSTEEVNTVPTSFSPTDPAWDGFGVSTAQATIGGTYSGENGTGALRFRVTRPGTHGVDDLTVRVYDPAGSFIEQIQVRSNHALDREYSLSNGLTFTLGAGDLADEDDFDVDVDASTSSFSPTSPVWNGAVSTAQASIGGIYDGSDGIETYTFQVTRAGVHGEDALRVRVLRSDGSQLQNINIGQGDPVDEVYTLNNGLSFTLGPGDLLDDDEFTVDVSDVVGIAVDPDTPFDAEPGFEAGFSVGAGSFEVNGVSISVLADDTLNDVVAKITASGANVTASFDVATEQVVLTQKTPGPVPTVLVGNDTSGFLAATKLTAAIVVPGTDGEAERPIAQVPSLASVSSGTLQINGVDVSIDVSVDSVEDVLDRINGAGAGATASFDPDANLITIASADPSQSLVLSDPTTGLLSAFKITPGSYDPTAGRRVRKREVVFEGRDALARDLRAVTRDLNALFADAFEGVDRERLEEFFTNASEAIRSAVEAQLGQTNRPTLRTQLGLDFHLAEGRPIELEFASRHFNRAAEREPIELFELLFGDFEASEIKRSGIVEVLDEIFVEAQKGVEDALGELAKGRLVDVRA